MVSGTWDFKWPRGTQIRVAFQQLSPSDAERLEHDFRWLIERFISIAQRWLRGDANIGFDYNVDRFLPAPPESDLKSVLLPEHGADPMDYDVLVSFATLPREVTPDGKRITGQVSVLGSYARRVGYGIPTTLVGPNQDYPGTSLPGYFDEKEKIFDHVVLHELGHVLGLPHEHQNPLWKGRPALIADEEVIKEKLHAIRGRFRTEFDPQVDQEIRKLWPGVQDGDAIQFSDWQPLEVPPGKFLEDYTVMAHPFWSALLREPPEGAQELKLRTHPSDKDFARLRHMYGQR